MHGKVNTPADFWGMVRRTAFCWLWSGPVGKGGYGLFSYGAKHWFVHRLAYTLAIGPVPSGNLVLRRCDNRHCCRPDHLFLGTQYDKEPPFWSRVQKTETCWLWTGERNSRGYGVAHVQGKRCAAHRRAYILARGPIPDGLFVCHHCDVRACVRPDHLFLGTALDNMRDKQRKGRGVSGMRLHPERAVRGERHPSARLTSEQVREIRSRYIPRKVTLKQLAGEYGISLPTCYEIVQGKIWRHLV